MYEALLVISTALLVIFLVGLLRHGVSRMIFLYLACGVGISGILIRPLGRIIAIFWYKLADLLSQVMSRVLMTLIYVLLLLPIATIYKLSRRDRLRHGKHAQTNWISRDHRYTPGDLKNIW